jgi:hypothetical protein
MAKHFKNFSNGFRLKPLSNTAFNNTLDVQMGDIAYLENTGLKFYDGSAWKSINIEGSEVQNSVLSYYPLQKSASVDATVDLYMDTQHDDYPTNDTNTKKQVSNKTIIIDLVSANGNIDDVTIHLPQGDNGSLAAGESGVSAGQTVTIYRKDSEKEDYTSQGEGKASVTVKAHTSDGNIYQTLNICGYTDALTYSSTTSSITFGGYSGVGSTSPVLTNTTLYNNKKLVFMFNGTNWILLNSKDQIQELLPIGTVLMSVLSEEAFNNETAGVWRRCNEQNISGSRLAQITGWSQTPGMTDWLTFPRMSHSSDTRITSNTLNTSYSNNSSTAMPGQGHHGRIGSRAIYMTDTKHLGLSLAVASNSSSIANDVHNHTQASHSHTISQLEKTNNIYDSGGYRSAWAWYGASSTTTSSKTPTINNDTHKHNLAISNAQFTTKTITGHKESTTASGSYNQETKENRPSCTYYNFLIRID